MIVLACETSTLLGSVAVVEDGRVLASEESFRRGSHSDMLNIFVEKALAAAGKKLADVDLFASGIGPGSFTGIRISLNTVKSLAYCFQKPVAGVSSLHTLAHQALSGAGTEPVIAMINAYKNMVYTATYRREGGQTVEVKKPEVLRVQNLADYLGDGPEEYLVCGDGYPTYEKFLADEVKARLRRRPEIPDEPHARTLGLLAPAQNPLLWSQLLPLYLRASEAEENLKGIKYQPLI